MVIVVTGCRKGIGREIVQYYLDKGDMVIGCSRQESDITHDRYYHYLVDVCDEKQVNHFAKEVRKITKKVDVLINNAGIAAMNHFMMTPVDTARRLMDTNYMGSFIASRAFISLLRKSDHPRIINFSSIAVPFCLEGEMAYASSKSAIETMTRILAKELASFNITVNAVGPTPIKTDLIAKVPEEKLNKILDAQAVHRFGEFADVINVIDFYVKPESDFITGQVLYLGGVS